MVVDQNGEFFLGFIKLWEKDWLRSMSSEDTLVSESSSDGTVYSEPNRRSTEPSSLYTQINGRRSVCLLGMEYMVKVLVLFFFHRKRALKEKEAIPNWQWHFSIYLFGFYD